MESTVKMTFTICWLSGFLSTGCLSKGIAIDWKIGDSYLWLKLENGEERWYPTKNIRWFSFGDNSKIE